MLTLSLPPPPGESLLLSKGLDDAVIGGTILVSGMLRFKVTHAGKDASLARIVDLIEQAQMSKAPIQRIAGRSWCLGRSKDSNALWCFS